MALPNAVTRYRGTKDTADNISQEKPLAISNEIWMYDPNQNKAMARVLSDSGKESITRRTFGHLEDSPHANWVEYAGNDSDGAGVNESSQQTTALFIKSSTGARLTTGSRVMWERTKEILRLTADMDSTTTNQTGAIARNFGRGAATDLLKVGDKGFILPPVFEEGFTMGKGLSNAKVYKDFEMSEISYPVQITFVENAEAHRGGDPFTVALNKALKQSKDQMEGELFFGAKKLDNTTYAHPIGATEGLDNWISTNVYNIQKLSRMDFFDILLEWQMNNKSGGVIYCSLQFQSLVTAWAQEKSRYLIPITGQPGDGEIGAHIDRVTWVVGTYDLIPVDLLNQGEYLAGHVFFVPNGHIDYRYLEGNGLNLDIAYRPVVRDEIHANEGEVYGVYGWEFFEEERFAKIEGLQLTG